MTSDANNMPEGMAQPGSPSRVALLVIGMHRSGTSALARMLSLLGAAMPEHIVGPLPGNETGHWEPERLVDLHEEMLAEGGSRWDDWRRFEPAALGPERLTHYRGEISRLVEEEYGDAPLFVLKDPRLCRFVPLYEEVLGEMGIAVRFILPHRNPVSVLASLAARDDMSASYAALVWLRHVLDAEAETRGKTRVFFGYEEYLDDWRAVAAKISSTLGLDWPRGADKAGREIDAYLSRDLQYHAATLDDLSVDHRLEQPVRDTYEALLALTAADGAAALETLSWVKEEFEAGQSVFADFMFEEMAVRQNRERLNREHLQRLLAKYQGEAEEKAAAGVKPEFRSTAAPVQVETLRDTVALQATELGRLGALSAVRELTMKQLSKEKTALDRQLAIARDNAAVQATRAGRIASERNDLQSSHAALKAEQAKLRESNKVLKTERDKSAGRNKTLNADRAAFEGQSKALEVHLAALRGSTSWRLTLPLRAAKLMATDPRRAISLIRARVSGARRQPATEARRQPATEARKQPAADVSTSPPAAETPPATAEKKPLPGMEQVTPEDEARARAAFDADFYLKRYRDVTASGVDPFEHYIRFGWKEGRDPSPAFSTNYYLQRAPAIARAGTNPFLHWISHGIHEKRSALPFRQRLELLDYAPKVSAIVPNYNHARFLEQRIDSILAQTYENVEILILDDFSTDDSRSVIERYREEHPDRIRVLYSEANSGNVFRQWRKGIENSTGELVWVCESDDFCEQDFLEVLVKNFRDRSVNIAFGRIQFSKEDGSLRQGLDQYRENAEPGIWDAPLTRPARRWFAGGFGVNNVIANVGGCIFRRQLLPEAVWDEAAGYSILGDWFLYCHLAGGGQIAYEPSAVAYFRLHDSNTSVASYTKLGYYEEHERLMLLLRRRWGVPDETVEAFHHKVVFQYDRHGLAEKLGPLESYCDKRKLLAEQRAYLHVLIAFMGFHPGGGEIFPIHLANTLRAQGHLVSMVALDMSEVNQEMFTTLDPAIPVYDAAWVEDYGADRFLSEAGVSLIHSHSIPLEAFFFERCRIEKFPYLVSLHGSYEATPPGNERLLRFILNVTHFVYTADKNLEPFRELPLSEKYFTKLGNAMPDDPRPFPKTRLELGIAEDAVVFTLVARGIQRKGWRSSIGAFLRLREAHPGRELHLLLCGDGEETDRNFALHGDDPDITFLGYQSRIHGLYRLSDVAIIPSRFAGESFPLCLVQSLQTGTPVIATRIGEIEGMIDGPEGAAGILIEEQRDTDLFTESLQEAMATMLSNSERERYARAARKKGETYSMDKVASDYTALYEELVKDRDPTTKQRHA